MNPQQARSRGPQAQAGARSSPVQRHVIAIQIPGRVILVALEAPNANNTASGASAQAVMGPQREAEDAWAALYYFTRIKDQQTLKERLIEYGRQRQDDDSAEALYQLSEEDLVYLFEMVNGNLESLRADGSNNNPDAAVRSEALDITGIKETVEYKDAFGRHYDPESLVDGQPGPLAGGAYLAGDGSQYTRIKFFRHDGSTYYRYARLIPKGTTPADQYAYDMSKVLDAAVAHGQAIRDQRLAAYMQAGNLVAQAAGDTKLILEDRDQTFEELFNAAAGHREGGREFTGYRMTYQDYLANSSQVVLGELEQRIAVQQTDWELKERELLDKIASWEGRVNTILERGRKNWSGAEDRFLAEWRKWRKDFDEKEEEARAAWDVKIADHFKAKEAWETGIRQNASEETIERVLSEAVLSLNAQMQNFGKQHGVALPAIDLQSTINKAVETMKRDMPAAAERLTEINKDIVNFKTHFALSEMVGADLLSGALSVAGDFQAEMNEHAKRMKVLSNVKIFEEYRKMQVEFKKSIQVQNESVDQSTAASAMAAGYMRQGSRFVKQAHGTASFGAVDAYSYFDAEGNLDAELAKSGFADKSGDDLVRFLEHSSEVEVESFLYTQKLALQSAMESILGRGGEKGSFGKWVGEGPDGQGAQIVNAAAGNSFSSNTFERGLAADIASGGSGELGAHGARPGGAPAGFYVQLKWMDSWVSQEQNRHIADRQAGMNVPVWDTVADILDPLIGMGYYQQIAKLEHGTKGGLIAEASLSNFVSNVFKVGGGLVVSAGVGIMAATGWSGAGFGVGAAIAAVGAGVVTLGNSMWADMKTGEKGVKLTDKAAISSGITIGLAAVGGAIAGSATSSAGSQVAAKYTEVTASSMYNATMDYMAMQFGTSAVQEASRNAAGGTALAQTGELTFSAAVKAAATSDLAYNTYASGLGSALGAGIQYDARGQSQGAQFSGKAFDAAMANWGMSSLAGMGVSSLGIQSPIASEFAGRVGNDLASYATQQLYGREFSNYAQLGMTGDWGGAVGLLGAWAKEANATDREQRALDLINGGGYAQTRREQEQYEAPSMTKEQAAHRIIAAYEAATGERLFEGDRQALLSTLSGFGLSSFSTEQADMFLYNSMGVNIADVDPAAFTQRYAAHAAAGQQYDANVRAQQALELRNENHLRMEADRVAAQEYLARRPWYEFANLKDFLARRAIKSNQTGGTSALSTGDIVKDILNPSDQTKLGVGDLFSSLGRDFGFGFSASDVKTAIDYGQFSNYIAGPDFESGANAIQAGQQGNYAAAAGYGTLAVAGIVLSKIKLLASPFKGSAAAFEDLVKLAKESGVTLHLPKRTHGVPDHWSGMLNEATDMIRSGQYSDVFLNKSLNTATEGKIASYLRPDVMAKRFDGTYDIFEQISPSQTTRFMQDKMQRISLIMGDKWHSGWMR